MSDLKTHMTELLQAYQALEKENAELKAKIQELMYPNNLLAEEIHKLKVMTKDEFKKMFLGDFTPAEPGNIRPHKET